MSRRGRKAEVGEECLWGVAPVFVFGSGPRSIPSMSSWVGWPVGRAQSQVAYFSPGMEQSGSRQTGRGGTSRAQPCSPALRPSFIKGNLVIFSWPSLLPTEGFPGGSDSKESAWKKKKKNLPAVGETWVRSLGQEDPLEKGTAAHLSILAWRIPWTLSEKSGELQSMGSQRVGLDTTTLSSLSSDWKTGLATYYLGCCFLPGSGETAHRLCMNWVV